MLKLSRAILRLRHADALTIAALALTSLAAIYVTLPLLDVTDQNDRGKGGDSVQLDELAMRTKFPKARKWLQQMYPFPKYKKYRQQLSPDDRRGFDVILPQPGFQPRSGPQPSKLPALLLLPGCQRAVVPSDYLFECETGIPAQALERGYAVIVAHGTLIPGTGTDQTEILAKAERKQRFPSWFSRSPLFAFNSGGMGLDWCTSGDTIDDVGYIRNVVKAATAKFPIDAGNLTLVGLSNGASMALNLTCSASDLFRNAIILCGVLGHNLHGPWNCPAHAKEVRALSTLFVYGIQDYQNGFVHLDYLDSANKHLRASGVWSRTARKQEMINGTSCTRMTWERTAREPKAGVVDEANLAKPRLDWTLPSRQPLRRGTAGKKGKLRRHLAMEACIVYDAGHCFPHSNKCGWHIGLRRGECGAARFDGTKHIWHWLQHLPG